MFFVFCFEVTITVTTQAEFCLAHGKNSRCRTQSNHHYEVFGDIGRDMHGQECWAFRQHSSGKDGWRGERDSGAGVGGEDRTSIFGAICRAGQQKFLWLAFHCMVALAASTTA